MGLSKTIWATPSEFIRVQEPDHPVLFFSPEILFAYARKFIDGFPGLVTYAVKSNPDEVVLANLASAGVRGYDVASPFEMEMVARIAPGADMHYNNPVRSRAEIATAVRLGVKSYSVDSQSELAKLAEQVPAGREIAVRFKLPVQGAAYNFGAKFGATAEVAVELLREVAALGYVPSLTFHPGTQCVDAMAWDTYIRAAADIARDAGIEIARLNVGGGFPSHRLNDVAPQLDLIFDVIDRVTGEAFGDTRPALVCEPGRGLVAECISMAARVKAIRDDEHVFLNDGIYGGLAELPVIGVIDRINVMSSDGQKRQAGSKGRIVFGPTCDSLDRLPGDVALPADMVEGDYVIFHGMGAYSTATVTRFNGYGALAVETVCTLAV